MLCYLMGEKSDEILSQVVPELNDSTRYETVKKKFNEYFASKRNVIFERYKFNSRAQQTGESMDTFVTALYIQAETCEFGNIKKNLIRDRIVIEIQDTRTFERLQLMNDLTANKALEIARQAEIQAKENKKIRKEISQIEINRIGENRKKLGYGSSKEKETDICRCGLVQHIHLQKCPAINSRYRRCGNIEH